MGTHLMWNINHGIDRLSTNGMKFGKIQRALNDDGYDAEDHQGGVSSELRLSV